MRPRLLFLFFFVLSCSIFVLAGAASPGPPANVQRAQEILPDTPGGWDLFEAPDGSFSILLPAYRKVTDVEDGGIVMHVVQGKADDGCDYAVLWSDTGDPTSGDGMAALLSGIAEGRGVSSDQGGFEAGPDRRAGLPGRKLRGVSEGAEMDLRAYADGPRLYQLYAQCPRETALDTEGRERTAFELATAQRQVFFASFAVRR